MISETQPVTTKGVENKRKLLCDVAARLFRANGFERTTVPEISKESGVSIGSIYRYVTNKEDFLFLMFQDVSKIMEENLYPLAELNLSPNQKLEKLMNTFFLLIHNNQDKFYVALRDAIMVEDFRAALIQQGEKTNAVFSETIQDGIEEGVFAPINADILAANIVFLGHMWVLRNYRFPNETIQSYFKTQFEFVKRIVTPG